MSRARRLRRSARAGPRPPSRAPPAVTDKAISASARAAALRHALGSPLMPAATRINQQRAVEFDPIAVRRNMLALIHAPENTSGGRIPVRGLLPQHQPGSVDRRSDRGVIGQRGLVLPYAGGRIADKAAA